ncbi:ABC transporter permease [Hymenobacter lucidus]|uniref:ABC transporter permease n=1 Tax=Hymenobacter lucidus TaxID=2880930 RepID=A0ABS8AM00_9BACT|nr:ABC transporter permease [Hymenobacter lucidus]MCB2407225.1 ABC transporter permease [Hymenobacter lucidus]
MPLPFAPDSPDLAAITQPPFSGTHWLGTDPMGRDSLAGLVFGARTVSLISVPAALIATLLGTLLGCLAGYWGNNRLRLPATIVLISAGTGLFWASFTGTAWWLGWATGLVVLGLWLGARRLGLQARPSSWPVPFDRLVLLLVAFLSSVPRLVLVLALAALQPPSAPMLLLVLALTFWPATAQLVRADMQHISQLPYIEAARALGLSDWRIITRHALPVIWKTVRATLPLSVATLLGLETTLSFLGVGLPPETASWGRMLATARLEPTAWWLIAVPATAILFTTLALRQLILIGRLEAAN